ncbi:MAG: response regulator [Phyllobacteriaceae bacterium]|nr:response regulator [Phyllobacteriaceae bacterium]
MSDEAIRVLYADDEEDILDVATLALELVGGLTVTTCSDGFQAVAAARAAPPDLIMLDVMMPGMDGPTAMSQIRADPSLGSIPVILLTARVRGPEVREYMALGADGVISKPFDPMTLADEVRTIWRTTRAKG